MATERRGRPRSTNWIGKFGEFVSRFTVERLAGELELDTSQVYRWVRGDYRLPVQRAIAIAEVARAAGTNLSLEDIYETDVLRIRVRMRSSLPPIRPQGLNGAPVRVAETSHTSGNTPADRTAH
jgi:hypothetical protein